MFHFLQNLSFTPKHINLPASMTSSPCPELIIQQQHIQIELSSIYRHQFGDQPTTTTKELTTITGETTTTVATTRNNNVYIQIKQKMNGV